MGSQSMSVVVGAAVSLLAAATVAPNTHNQPEIRAVESAADDQPGFLGRGESPSRDELSSIDFVDLTVIEESLHVWSWDGTGTLTVCGEVRNDSDLTLSALSLGAVALDAEGELLDTVRRVIFASSPAERWDSAANLMAPGSTALFTATLGSSIDAAATILIRATGIETEATPGDLTLEQVGDWEVDEMSPGVLLLRGRVRNPTASSIVGLRVTVAARAPSGAVLDVGRTYPRANLIGGYLGGLRPGEETEVALNLYLDPADRDTAQLETVVTGRPYGGGSFRYGIAGIAHNAGARGSVWRSSLTLTNRSGAPAAVALNYEYLEGNEQFSIELDHGETFHRDDVVRTVFGVAGPSTGYVQVTSSTPLTVTGRTSNERTEGSFGQVLPVFTPEMTTELLGGGVLSGLRGGERFRSNIGLVNMGTRNCACSVRMFDLDGNLLREWPSVPLGPTYWHQLNDVMPADAELASAVVEPEFGCWMWAYASVIDEVSGDPTTIMIEPATVIDLSPGLWGAAIADYWADWQVVGPPRP
jgi:hypothetical protein